jgi:hypothetical protein
MAFVTWEDTTADGVQTDFNTIFNYLSEDHVEVKFDGAVQASSLYTFISTSQIRFTSPPADGVVVRVGRNTPQTVQTDFAGGAILPEADLDNSYLQLLYSIQELQDQINEQHP